MHDKINYIAYKFILILRPDNWWSLYTVNISLYSFGVNYKCIKMSFSCLRKAARLSRAAVFLSARMFSDGLK